MIVWGKLAVVGLLGASYMNHIPAEGPPFNGAMVPPGIDMHKALSIVNGYRFFAVESLAEGGATAFSGFPGPNFKGYQDQFQALLDRMNFPFSEGNNLKIIVIDGTNSCLHAVGSPSGLPCTDIEIEAVFDEMETVVRKADSMGIKVLITGYPDYLDLDPELVKQTYGLPWFIEQDRYEYLVNRLQTRVADWPAEYFPVWSIVGVDTFDGIHLSKRSMFKNAVKLMVKIMQVLNA